MPWKTRLAWPLWRDVRTVLRAGFAQLAVFEAIFKLVSIVLFAPLSALFLAKLLAWSGNHAVSNYELAAFFLSPWGASLIVAGATLAFAIFYLEQTGLILIALARQDGQSVSVYRLTHFAARRFAGLCRLGLRQFGIYLLAALPFLAVIGGAYAFFLGEGDINYYLQVKPPAFWWTAGIASIAGTIYLIVALRFFVLWIFSVPVFLLEGKTPAESMRGSSLLARERFSTIVSALLWWLGAVFALSAVGAAALSALEWLLLELAGNRAALALGFVALSLALNLAAAVALSFFAVTTCGILVARLYRDAVDSVELPESLVVAGRDETPAGMRSFRVGTGTALAILTLLTGFFSYRMISRIQLDNTVRVTAHRGSSLKAPENTLSAVEHAIADGADYAEIDVQETADGVVVMIHDSDLKRIAGVNRNIWEINRAELEDLDVGSWFSKEFSGERIATLAEVIDLAAGKIKLNIELKFNGHDKQLAEEVCRIVDEKVFGHQCVITCLEYGGLRAVRARDSGLKTGLIVTASIGDVTKLDADFLSVAANAVSRDLIHRAHDAGKEVHVWTVNEPGQMNTMIHLGVDNIITDVPEVLVDLLREREEFSQAEKVMLWLGDFLEGRL